MWICNICFKTFDRSTSYFNHRRSHRSSSKHEMSSSEDLMEESSLNYQTFSKEEKACDANNDERYDDDKLNKSESKCNIIFDESPIFTININEITSNNDDNDDGDNSNNNDNSVNDNSGNDD